MRSGANASTSTDLSFRANAARSHVIKEEMMRGCRFRRAQFLLLTALVGWLVFPARQTLRDAA